MLDKIIFPSLSPPSEDCWRRHRLKLSAHHLYLRWLLRSSKVSGVRSWGTALVKISPYTFSAVGIGVSIGVSVLSAAWGIYVLQSRLPESLPRISLGLIFLSSIKKWPLKCLVLLSFCFPGILEDKFFVLELSRGYDVKKICSIQI
ncbi:hypothetical protein HN51_066149 [Arachis hypogaea]